MGPAGPETKNVCADEGQQQIIRPDQTRPDQTRPGQQKITALLRVVTERTTLPLIEEGAPFQNT
jgi:hypothetical protein